MRSLAPRSQRSDGLLTAAFLLALASPSIDRVVRTDAQRGPEREERTTAPLPALGPAFEDWSRFPERYDDHFNDTLGLRDRLLRWRSIVHLFGFGRSPTDGMQLGSDGWLFYTGARSVPMYRGVDPLTDAEIDGWLARWEARRDALARRGIQYLFVIAPNKESIYAEHVASRWNRVGPTRLDQIAARLAARPDLPVLDLRKALLAEKRRDTATDFTYYPLGTHWNGRGHWAAYRAIAEALQARFPAVEPRALDQLAVLAVPGHGDTWGPRMYVDDLMPQRGVYYAHPPASIAPTVVSVGLGKERVRVYATDRADLPRGVVLHDSFGPGVCELLAPSFQSLACTHASEFDWPFVDLARPDVVIELYIERILASWPALEALAVEDDDAARFASSEREIYRLDLASTPTPLTPHGATALSYDRKLDPPALVVRPAAREARFALPVACRADAGEVVLRVEIESSAAATLRVHYVAADAERYTPKNFRWALLARGANQVHLRFAAAELAAPLQFVLTGPSASYAVRSVAVRGMELGG